METVNGFQVMTYMLDNGNSINLMAKEKLKLLLLSMKVLSKMDINMAKELNFLVMEIDIMAFMPMVDLRGKEPTIGTMELCTKGNLKMV